MTDENTSWYKKGLIEYSIYDIDKNNFLMSKIGGYCWVPHGSNYLLFRSDQVDSYVNYQQKGTVDENICKETGTSYGLVLIEFVAKTVGWKNIMFIPAILTGELHDDGIKKIKLDFIHSFGL